MDKRNEGDKMAKSHNQKAKILILERMLCGTGENCVVTMQEILEKLMEYGITAERKSIYDDIEALRDFGMDIRYRRGKPGGYFLSGEHEMNIPDTTIKEKEDKNQPEEEKKIQQKECDVPLAGVHEEEIQDMSKTMKLRFSAEHRKDVEKYFGSYGEYRRKEDEFTAVVPLTAGPNFYGWMVSMNGEVHIAKPKKSAAGYRDYLKALAKEYKGI